MWRILAVVVVVAIPLAVFCSTRACEVVERSRTALSG